MIRKIFSNLFSLGIGSVVAFGAGALFHILLARHAGTVEYGKYAFGLSFAGLFFQASEFGLTSMVVRNISSLRHGEPRTHFGAALLLRFALTLVFLCIGIVALSTLHLPSDKFWTVFTIFIAFGVLSTNLSIRWAFQAYNRLKFEALANVLIPILNLAIALFLITFSPSVWIFALGFLIANIGGLLFSAGLVFRYFPRPIFRGALQQISSILRTVWPFAFIVFATAAYQNISVIMLNLCTVTMSQDYLELFCAS